MTFVARGCGAHAFIALSAGRCLVNPEVPSSTNQFHSSNVSKVFVLHDVELQILAANSVINPYQSPSSVAAGFHSTGLFRFVVAALWLLGIVVFVIACCTGCYFEGAYCPEIDCPRFIDITCFAALAVALVSSVAYPGTVGRRCLHFLATCVAISALFCFAVFFSMVFLGFDIAD